MFLKIMLILFHETMVLICDSERLSIENMIFYLILTLFTLLLCCTVHGGVFNLTLLLSVPVDRLSWEPTLNQLTNFSTRVRCASHWSSPLRWQAGKVSRMWFMHGCGAGPTSTKMNSSTSNSASMPSTWSTTACVSTRTTTRESCRQASVRRCSLFTVA